MRKLFLLFLFFSMYSCKKEQVFLDQLPVNTEKLTLSNYVFVGQDDFAGNVIDTSIWTYHDENIVRGFGKMLRSNIIVNNGSLKILSKRNSDNSFSAGMVSTRWSFLQKYGYFEVRAKMHQFEGPHAAFWLLNDSVGVENAIPNPSIFGTEIDVFEYHHAGQSIDNILFNLHWNGYNFTNGSHQTVGTSVNIPGINTGFHVFGLEWTPKEYIFYVDGVEKARTSIAVSHIREYMLLSSEINGFGGDRFNMPLNGTDTLEFDYVKVFSLRPAVYLFEHDDYYGWVSSPLFEGSYNYSQLLSNGAFNNQTSSIEVPVGWRVVAYDGENFNGDSVIVTSSYRSAGIFNDRVSSVRVYRQ